MKKKQQKQNRSRQTEKANAEIETPKNIDFVEIPMPNEELDKIVQKNASLLAQRNDPVLRKHVVRRQKKLLHKIFRAATQVLTDSQFQIFTLRYIYQLPEKEIAQQLKRNQSYIPLVLKNCIKKIQKKLRITVDLQFFSRDRKDKDLNEEK